MPKREEVPGQICVAQMTHFQNGMPSRRGRGREEDSHLYFWCGREIWLGGVAFPPHSHRQVADSHGHAVLALVKEAEISESDAQGHLVHGVGCGRPVRPLCHVAGGSPSHRDRSGEVFLSAQPCNRHRNCPSAHLARIARIAAHAFPLHAGPPGAAHEAAVLKCDIVGGFSLAGHRLAWSSRWAQEALCGSVRVLAHKHPLGESHRGCGDGVFFLISVVEAADQCTDRLMAGHNGRHSRRSANDGAVGGP